MANPLFKFLKKGGGSGGMLPKPSGWLFVALPTLLTFFFLLFMASDRYTATSQFIIKQSSSNQSPALLGIPFLGTQTTTSREDALVIQDFISSYNLMRALEEEHQVLKSYQEPTVDFWQRLPEDASEESKVEYFSKKITITINPESSIVTLETSAFTPEMAELLNTSILQASEDFINQISISLANAQTGFVEGEVRKSEAILAKARQDTLVFQEKYNLIDPEGESAALFGRISELEGMLSQKKTELKTLQGILQEDSPRIAAVKNEIDALEIQIEEETLLLAGGEDISLNQIMVEYQELRIEQEFALNSYTTALTSLEQARTEAARQMKFLITISQSGVPDDTSGPKIFRDTLEVFLIAGLIYLVLRLVVATINDHKN